MASLHSAAIEALQAAPAAGIGMFPAGVTTEDGAAE
jgi:hypothetical protein